MDTLNKKSLDRIFNENNSTIILLSGWAEEPVGHAVVIYILKKRKHSVYIL